jgi:hypothetical protein
VSHWKSDHHFLPATDYALPTFPLIPTLFWWGLPLAAARFEGVSLIKGGLAVSYEP